ncbi:MAG: DUF2797 domain-containing protein [Bacteroidetes bacterium]|nr:MAG: DUF2797 domain-containing protein [Bacteroidota bacterium]MBL1144349.1 DUF2797 domain-containing protein [Bacteroidota bacterium]NOG57145.1 DUF2797 domain-containing protein [Bacteroidota bacterium]
MEKREFQGNLHKMKTTFESPVKYELILNEDVINMTKLVGTSIKMSFTGQINCVNCGRLTSKSFAQGFCFPCFRDAPQNAECIIRPELCEAHLGKGRDPEWEEKNHNQPHVVYLAVSSGIKVGVTRETQVPYRWIDQGASKAIKIAETENRYQAGMIEVALKEFASDKTPWQKMLKNEVATSIDIIETKDLLIEKLDDEWQEFASDDDEIIEIDYPAIRFPHKVKSHNLDKTPILEGKLEAIKGQYLIFEGGIVINIRKYGGYFVSLEVEA